MSWYWFGWGTNKSEILLIKKWKDWKNWQSNFVSLFVFQSNKWNEVWLLAFHLFAWNNFQRFHSFPLNTSYQTNERKYWDSFLRTLMISENSSNQSKMKFKWKNFQSNFVSLISLQLNNWNEVWLEEFTDIINLLWNSTNTSFHLFD